MIENPAHEKYVETARDRLKNHAYYPRVEEMSPYCFRALGQYLYVNQRVGYRGKPNRSNEWYVTQSDVEGVAHATVAFGRFDEPRDYVAVPWIFSPDGVNRFSEKTNIMHFHSASEFLRDAKDEGFVLSKPQPDALRGFAAARGDERTLLLFTTFRDQKLPDAHVTALRAVGQLLSDVVEIRQFDFDSERITPYN